MDSNKLLDKARKYYAESDKHNPDYRDVLELMVGFAQSLHQEIIDDKILKTWDKYALEVGENGISIESVNESMIMRCIDFTKAVRDLYDELE